jgi:hypothetical protein
MSCGEGFFDAGKNSQWEVKFLVKETFSAMEISVWDSCGEGFFDAGKNSQWEVKFLVKETLSAMEISVWDELRRRLF